MLTESNTGESWPYDGDGVRVKKSSALGTTVFWYGGRDLPLAETDQNGVVLSRYVYLNGIAVARIDGAGNVYYYLHDHLGTTRVMTTSAGAVCYDGDYFPHGAEQHVYVNSCPQSYKFTGKERDPESGADYFNARWYNQHIGRFHVPDWSATPTPVPYADFTDPQTLNLYSYVRNNPTSRVDPDGHSDYLWQKLKNKVSGNGWKTDAQVNGWSVAQTAQNHLKSMDWAINGMNTSGKDAGHPQNFKPGRDKCNQFVGDTLAEAGKTRPEVPDGKGGMRMPSAHELADPNVHIPGLSDTKPLSQAKAGDVIAQEHGDTYGHAGIVVTGNDGNLATVSANATGNYGGQITQNDWGFRPTGQNGESATDSAPVVREPQ
jgi:RHS repeat-associated protein